MDDLVKRLREGDPDLWAMKKAADRIESLEHELAETKLRASKIEILADRLAAILRKLCDVIDQNDNRIHILRSVLVRAFGGEPVRLVEIDRTEKLVYVAAESSLSRVSSGETEPVGVPAEDVLPFSERAYKNLMAAWKVGASDAMWGREFQKLGVES